MLLEETISSLAGQLIVRPATLEDAELYFPLFDTFMREHFGSNTVTAAQLRNDWQTPNFDVERDTRLVVTLEGKAVGYLEVWAVHEMPVRPHLFGYVHPDYRNQGIGATLLQWAELRACQVFTRVPEQARVVVSIFCHSSNTAAQQLFEQHGFARARCAWDMLIELDAEPAAPAWPDGITVSTLAALGDLAAVYQARTDAFQDHREYVAESFEAGFARFQHFVENNPNHDPTLWFVALAGEKVAGISLCEKEAEEAPDRGFVDILGVRREYRRRGVGLALLQHSFRELWRRGQRKVGLGVDAASLTGATRLYEKAGMRVEHAWDVYEKELRPGVEISNQG